MEALKRLYGQLRLRINEAKSAVARPWDRTFLGYSFWVAPGRRVKRRIAPTALDAMKTRVRGMTARSGGRSMQAVVAELRSYLTGWKAYFRLAETPNILGELDQWVRHRLRMVQLKQWKRGTTIYREMTRLGANEDAARRVAANARRWWSNSAKLLNSALPSRYYDRLGVPRLASSPQPSEPPDADPPVRWCGRGSADDPLTPIPIRRPGPAPARLGLVNPMGQVW